MTLWQIFVAVAVAWLSGALFGVGWADLRQRARTKARPAAKFSALEAALEAAAPTAGDGSGVGSPACEPTAKPQRPHFWFVDEEVSEADATAAPHRAAADTQSETAGQVPEAPVDAPMPGEGDAAETPAGGANEEPTAAGAEEPMSEAAAKADDTRSMPAMAEAADTANGLRLVSSVRAAQEESVPAPAGRSKKHRNDQDKAAKRIARWRAQDRRAQSRGLMFWVEIALLILILIGVSWGMVYFVTQPLAGGLR